MRGIERKSPACSVGISGTPTYARPDRHHRLRLKLGLGQPDGTLTLFPLTALLEDLNALKTLEHRTLATDGVRSFQGGVFGHDYVKVGC